MRTATLHGFLDEVEKIGFSLRSPKTNWESHEKELEESRRKAEEIRQSISNRFNVSPFLTGSLATGLNKPGDADYDFGIRVQARPKFDALVARMNNTLDASPYNKPNTDYHVFSTKIRGEDIDIALMYGDKGKVQRDALHKVIDTLSEQQRKDIVQKKVDLQNAWFFKDQRYKAFKRSVDAKLGLPKFKRDELDKTADVASDQQAARLERSDIFGHRTDNIEPILKSQVLLSAVDLARSGVLKNYETIGLFRSRSSDLPTKLRSEVFITKGLLPPNESYGRYGIMFQKKNVEKSKYLNMIPEEYTTDRVNSKMTFVVPDSEIKDWTKRFPSRTFLQESRVPDDKRLKVRDLSVPFQRLLNGVRLTQKKEEV